MTKAEIIDKMSNGAGLSKADAARSLNAFIDCLTYALKKGQKVTIIGFGTFTVSKRKARTGRDPRSGKEISIPASKVPRFTAGKALKVAVR